MKLKNNIGDTSIFANFQKFEIGYVVSSVTNQAKHSILENKNYNLFVFKQTRYLFYSKNFKLTDKHVLSFKKKTGFSRNRVKQSIANGLLPGFYISIW